MYFKQFYLGCLAHASRDTGSQPESISILVIDTEVSAGPQKVLTGDALFIGDVGRPDLAGSRGYTPEMMRRCSTTVCTGS